MQMISVELSQDRRVRNPDTGLVLEAGKSYRVPATQFWLKRLQDGDVLLLEEKKSEAKPEKKKK